MYIFVCREKLGVFNQMVPCVCLLEFPLILSKAGGKKISRLVLFLSHAILTNHGELVLAHSEQDVRESIGLIDSEGTVAPGGFVLKTLCS